MFFSGYHNPLKPFLMMKPFEIILILSTLTLDEPPMYLWLTLVDISSSTYLPNLVNVVIECPLIDKTVKLKNLNPNFKFKSFKVI